MVPVSHSGHAIGSGSVPSPQPAPLVLAHRGARMVAPENTLEAFSVALAQGADGVELDVHCTADGALVVHHDAEAVGLGILAERQLADIRAERPEIPTLDEVLDACEGSLVNIEIKNLPTDADYDDSDRAAALVVQLLDGRGHRDDVLVSSFNLATIDRVRELEPAVPTGYLSIFDPLEGLDICAEHGHGALHPFFALVSVETVDAIMRRAQDLDVAINVWTVNDGDEMVRFAAAGVAAIITDVPDLASRMLTSPDA
jgi:glycerophosphoryl diester phosphodiesterase